MGKCVYCGAETDSLYRVCPECEPKLMESYESDLRGYFLLCPLCGAEKLKTHLVFGGRDALTCEQCGAKWHLYFGLTGFKWAELELASRDKKGLQLLGKQVDKNEWRKMAMDIQKDLPQRAVPQKISKENENAVKEREIIREKEVIVKIRCPYCHGLYDEAVDKCPHCGGKR